MTTRPAGKVGLVWHLRSSANCVLCMWEHACTCAVLWVRVCGKCFVQTGLTVTRVFSRVLCSPGWSGCRQKIITVREPQQWWKDKTGTGFILLLQRTSRRQLGEKRGRVNSRRAETTTEDEYANYSTLYWTSVKSHTPRNQSIRWCTGVGASHPAVSASTTAGKIQFVGTNDKKKGKRHTGIFFSLQGKKVVITSKGFTEDKSDNTVAETMLPLL